MPTHPSKNIIGSEGRELDGKTIVLCITGSVAAINSPEIARHLMRRGAEVFAVMSAMSQRIIHPHVMEWATGNPVVTELTGKIEHVALIGEHSERADLVLVAPATANTISKIACGIDDTPVTSTVSTAFGSNSPILIVPAMHESMYNHRIVSENIKKLKDLNVGFVGPRIEERKAKIAETPEIVDTVIRKLTIKQDFSGMKVMVTAGSTVEYLDPIRVITNRSSGKMGARIAEETLNRGAETTFIYGSGAVLPPPRAHLISVETTDQMDKAVVSELKSKKYDIVIAVAAAADWAPEKPYSYKVSTHRLTSLEVKLKPTKKIIDRVKKISPKTFLVAFRAEYNLSKGNLVESAHERLLETKADLVVANDVAKQGVGFGTDTNEVFIIDKQKNVVHVPLSSKEEVAKKVLDAVKDKMRPK